MHYPIMENTIPANEASTSYAQLLKAIRTAAETPSADDGKRLCELVWKLSAGTRDKSDRDAAKAEAETVMILHRILKTRTGAAAMARHILEALCGLGEFGRMIAGRHVRSGSISGSELSAMLPSMPVQARLAIADELLAEGVEDMPRGAKETADMLMASISKDDAPEAAAWLARAGARHWTVSHPLAMSLGPFIKGVQLDTIHLANAFLALGGYGMDATMQKSFEAALRDGLVHQEIIAAADRMLPSAHPFRTVIAKSGLKLGGEAGRAALILYASSDIPGAGKTLARLYASTRQPGIAATASLLCPGELKAFFASLKGQILTTAISQAFDIAARLAPKELLAALDEEPSETKALTGPIKKYLSDNRPPIRPLPRCRSTRPEDSGLINKLFREGRYRKLAKIMVEKKGQLSDFDPQIVENLRVLKFDRKGVRASGSTFLKNTFEHCSMDSWAIAESHFFGCTFEQCTFSRSDLAKCRFRKCTFKACTFDDCILSDALFRECKFQKSSFVTCDLHGLQAYQCSLRETRFREASLSGSEWTQCRLIACRVRNVSLKSSLFYNTSFKATEFQRSTLGHVLFHGCPSHQTFFERCGTNELEVREADTTCPEQMGAWLAGIRRRMLENKGSTNSGNTPASLCPVAARALFRLSRHIEFIKREKRMLQNDSRRLESALRKLSPDQRDFLTMMPYLLHTDVFEKSMKTAEPFPCTMASYTPTLTTLSTMSDHFGPESQERVDRTVTVTALYSMGSMGSLAQTSTSDLDCWLVVKSGTASRDDMAMLNRKCRALEQWSWEEFSLETHFFVMGEDAVRANRFGLSDSESSGSAQAILLKEEFYRTALKIAGHHPVWWLSDPGCSSEEYATTVASALKHPLGGSPRMIDLGPLPNIPAGEYFGAALWQMIKAIHSPFKSVMKLGLLDRYSSMTAEPSLADLIKKRILEGEHGSARVDPYAAMYLELKEMYSERKDKDATRLLAEAFLLKADLSSLPYFRNLPATREAQSLVEMLFGSGYVSPEVITCDDAPWSFSQSLEAGAAVSDFMTASYKRIRSMIANAENSSALITPEDLTRLGRRILANFARKPNKVSRIPFLDVGKDTFAALRFSAVRKSGRKTVWHLQATQASGGRGASKELQELNHNEQAAMLPAWLVANSLYRPESQIQADKSILSLAAADLQRLLSAMAEFFPYEETFEPDLDEGLRQETVTKAFLIINLDVPPETKTIETVAVVYSTNWGEMFCQTVHKPDESIQEHTSDYLDSVLEHSLDVDAEFTLFMPRGAQCPRLTLI